jgi:hypothetical protein
MRPSDDPVPLTADERFREVAGILAAAVLRLGLRSALAVDDSSPENPENLALSCLEVSPDTVLSVHGG